MRGSRWAILLLASTAVLSAGVASAHDHQVPDTTLRILGQSQEGRLWSSTWLSRSGPNVCAALALDGVRRFHRPLEVAKGTHPARLLLHKRQRPQRLRIDAYTMFDDRSPTGEPDRLPYELQAIRRDGEVRAWRARFHVTLTNGKPRVLLNAYGRWRDAEGCGGSQDASWTFSLRRG